MPDSYPFACGWPIVLGSLLVLAGCAAPPLPAHAPAVTPPAYWSGQRGDEQALDSAAWWASLGDPMLAGLVARALEANTDVRTAQAHLRQARAARALARAALSPALTLGSSLQAMEGGSTSTHRLVQAGVDGEWDLDLFGGNRRAEQASRSDLLARTASLAQARNTVAAEMAIGYIELRGNQARLAILRDNLQALRQATQLAQWRAESGLVSSLDVLRAQSTLAQLQAQQAPLEAAVVQSIDGMSLLAGDTPDRHRAALQAVQSIPLPPRELTLAIPARTLARRPDVEAAGWAVEAAAARVAQSDAARLPTLLLRGSLTWSALSIASLGGSAARSLVASSSLPLFDAGARRARTELQQSQLDAALADFDAAMLAALREVEDLLAKTDALRERLALLRTATDGASAAAALALNRYQAGLADFQAVLDAQRTLLAVQDDGTATQAEYAASHVRLFKALGGGWPAPEPTLGAWAAEGVEAKRAESEDSLAVPTSPWFAPWALEVMPRWTAFSRVAADDLLPPTLLGAAATARQERAAPGIQR